MNCSAARNLLRIALIVVFCIAAIALLAFPFMPEAAHAAPDVKPEKAVAQAWKLAGESGNYHFSTRIVQTTHLAPSIANVGRGSKVETLFMDGDADVPSETLHLSLWQNGGSVTNPADATEIRIEGAQAYGRVGDGAWQEMENISSGFAPGNDALAYLAGAKNIRQINSGLLSQGDAARYAFTLNGPALANHIRTQFEDQLRQTGKLPPGISLSTPDQFRNALGDGELWVDADGLPQRLTVTLTYPQQQNGEQVEVQIETDYSKFNSGAVASEPSPVDGLKAAVAALQSKARQSEALLALSSMGLLGLMLFNRQSKKVYLAIVIVVIFSMVVTPLLQSAQIYAFYQDQEAQQLAQEHQQKEQEVVDQLEAERYGSTWDPHTSQWSLVSDQLPANGEQSSTDTDHQSPIFNSQAQSIKSRAQAASEDSDVDPDSDSDGDGLTYAQEMRLGTNPEQKDTDGDAITDNAEVAGFEYNNQHWYSDPLEPDTNNDGISDGYECQQKAVSHFDDSISPEDEACEDTDGDGTPDIFDRDNDGDGVPDKIDISLQRVVAREDGSPFDGDNPLQLQVDALQPNEPAFIDFQLRPEDPEHLWYALNYLDWPSGDEKGQIQRKTGNDSTYADAGDPAASADNGDMRMIPMLEIEIPYQEGHYANLPTVTNPPTRTPDNLDDWLDRTELDGYGIAVREADHDGDLYVYVPITLVQDQTGEDRVAFAARMLYWPTNAAEGATNADWGATQNVRLVWIVQMLVDYCDPDSNSNADECSEWILDTAQVVSSYTDAWRLTGLQVREDHGLDVAIIYEDPAEEPSDEKRSYDDWLWALSNGLGETYVTGRDCYPLDAEGECDGDGVRDITIPVIQARFDNRVNGGTSEEERWGVPITATQVATFAYEHEDFVAHIMVTETQQILSDTFTPYIDQGADTPTLMFAQEARYRSLNLADTTHAVLDGNLLRLNFDQEDLDLLTRTYLNWAPYRYNAEGGKWENYPVNEYLDKIEIQLKDSFTEFEDNPDYEEIRRGHLMLAQSYYLSVFSGIMGLVAAGDELVGGYATTGSLDSDLHDWSAEIPNLEISGSVMTKYCVSIGLRLTNLFDSYLWMREMTESARMWIEVVGADAWNNYEGYGGHRRSLHDFEYGVGNTKVSVTLAVGAVIALGLMVTALALYVEGNERDAKIVMNSAAVVITATDLLHTCQKWFHSGPKDKHIHFKAFVVAIIIVAVLMITAYVVTWALSGERWDGLAFTFGLASVFASLFAMIIIMAICAIPVVGQIIAGILFLIDAIWNLVCSIVDESHQDEWYCQGLTGLLALGIRKVIFNQNLVVAMEDEDRFKITDFDQSLVDASMGMQEGNSVKFTVDYRENIRGLTYSEIKDDWMSVLYSWQFDNWAVDNSTFNVTVDASKIDRHGEIDTKEWENLWELQDDEVHHLYDGTAVNELPLPIAGINRPLSLYINEGFVVEVQECWTPPVVCYLRAYGETNHVDMGHGLQFDVFPDTLDGFFDLAPKDGGYALAWSPNTSPTFPRLADADGDGLLPLVAGGADPDDSMWDTDLDGLSDLAEIRFGTNSQDVDSDDDGLTDYEEILLDTNPNRADSDYDGLTDQEELAGWEFVYAFAVDGSQLRAWVTSDPLQMDADGDGFSDFQEKTYGFNPRVASDPNILTLETTITETDAPRLLLRLDERANASLFTDDSGYLNNGSCTGGACPIAGHTGRYSNAPHFDGEGQYLTVAGLGESLTSSALTFGGWAYPEAGMTEDGRLFAFNTAGGGNFNQLAFDQDTGQFYYYDGAVGEIASSGSYALDTWHHVAVVIDAGDSGKLYVNGTLEATFSTTVRPAADSRFSMGQEWDGDTPSNFFLGFLDEAAAFDYALTQAEITETMEGRYNPDDLAVAPGDTLGYEASVQNELFNRYAQGYLSTNFPAAFTELDPQAFILNPQEALTLTGEVVVGSTASGVYTLTQEADALITNWREDSDYAEALFHFNSADSLLADSSGTQPPRDGECASGHCPVVADGRYSNGAAFDGSNDYIWVSDVEDSLTDSGLTMGGWFYLDAAGSGRDTLLSFSRSNYKFKLVYSHASQEFSFHAKERTVSSNDVYNTAHSFAPGQWYHVMFTMKEDGRGTIYINGVKEKSFSHDVRVESSSRFVLGAVWDDQNYSEHFAGSMDEIVVYPRALTAQEVQVQFNNPIFYLPLDEGVDATRFADESGFNNDGGCAGDGCPDSGEAGLIFNAADFDGEDDVIRVAGSSGLDVSSSDFTLAAWIYPEPDMGEQLDCPFLAEYFDNTHLYYNGNTRKRCEDYPIEHAWAVGEDTPHWGRDDDWWAARWSGTFFFTEGTHTFTFRTNDGMRAWLDGTDQLLDEWHDQGATTYTVDRYISGGWHSIMVEYYDWQGAAVAEVSWTPEPLGLPQGILGSDEYPALHRAGNQVWLVLNPDTAFLTADEVLTEDTWNHVAAAYDGSTWFLYVDGVEVDQFAVAGETPGAETDLSVGRASRDLRLDLQYLYASGTGSERYDDGVEYRIELQLDGGEWQEVWGRDGIYTEDWFALNLSYLFAEQAVIRMYESDENDPGEGDDDPMGTYTIDAEELSSQQGVKKFATDESDSVRLRWRAHNDSMPFHGKIDEATVYKTALAPDQVEDLAAAGDLMLYLPFEDAPGTEVFAEGLGRENGTCSGDTCPTAGVQGRDGMAVLFDGHNDTVMIDDLRVNDLKSLSLSTWVYIDDLSADMIFIDVDGKANLRYGRYGAQDGLHFIVYAHHPNYSGSFNLSYTGALQAGVWYHVTGTYDDAAKEMRLYLNGTEVNSRNTAGFVYSGDGTVTLSSDDPVDGRMDDVRIYRRGLSAAEVQEIYDTAPSLLLLLDETHGATTFADATSNGHTGTCSGDGCPTAGPKGQIGLAADFDGVNDHIQVANALPTGQQELTLAFWVKPETLPEKIMRFVWLDGEKAVLRYDGTAYGGPGQLHFYMNIGGSLRSMRVDNVLTEGYWYHIAGTYNGEAMRLYLNGNEIDSLDVTGTVSDGSTLNLGTAGETLNGRLDHVTLYTRALEASEIRAMFRLQAKWVEDRQSASITVDNDAPVSTLVSPETHYANETTTLLVHSEDPTTFVTMVEMFNSAVGAWESVPACVDSQDGTAWCPTFEPVLGEGSYTLQFRGTDNVGHRETLIQTYTIIVDETPPADSGAPPSGEIYEPVQQPDHTWLVALAGTVVDPNVGGAPGSGTAQVLVKLTDTDPVTDTLPALVADLAGNNWTIDYPLVEADPTGVYTLAIQTADTVGNTSAFIELYTIEVDAASPDSGMDDINAQLAVTGSITTALQITGAITENKTINIGVAEGQVSVIPAAMSSFSGTVGVFHFDEPAGATQFAGEPDIEEAVCSGSYCPAAGASGVWGRALAFDGNNDRVVHDSIPAQITDAHGLAFGVWVYPTASFNPVLVFEEADGSDRHVVEFSNLFVYEDPQIGRVFGSARAMDQWYHLMVTIDEDGNGTLYVDGQMEFTFQTDVRPDPDGRLRLGYGQDGTANGFEGRMDELTVYDRVLTASEVHSLYAEATLTDNGEGTLNTTWAYTLPLTLDGLYEINIRTQDVYSNTEYPNQRLAWKGEIDTRGPRVDLQIVEKSEELDSGVPYTASTTYTCRAQDFNLTKTGFDCPCNVFAPASTIITDTYYHEASPWYAEVLTDTTRLYETVHTCTVLGLSPAPNLIQACDIYGHCTTGQDDDVETAYGTVPHTYSNILTPTHNTILTSTADVTIEGISYSYDRLESVTVKKGYVGPTIGIPVTNVCAVTTMTMTEWTQTWTGLYEGKHQINSVADPCGTGMAYTEEPHTIIVDVTPPSVPVFPSNLNRDQRISWGRVALSGTSADATSGMAAVEVSVDGSDWEPASIQGSQWRYEWWLGEEPDGAQYAVSVRATDRAGWVSQHTQTVTVDLDVPNPITMTMTSDVTGGAEILPNTTLRQIPATLTLDWESSTLTDKLLPYQVQWTVHTTQTTQLPPVLVPADGPLTAQFIAGEAQRVEVQVTSTFTDGNTQVDNYGPFYVDTQLTPDYISMEPGSAVVPPYHGWIETGCSVLGIDRRIQENAPAGQALADPQNFYASWDSEGLRLAWTGANWDYNGDLFIYMDDLRDPSAPKLAYNFAEDVPADLADDIVMSIPGGKSFVWVESSSNASLHTWNGVGYDYDQLTHYDRDYFRFDAGLNGGHTDIYIPFAMLGITEPLTTQLVLFAFATEEDEMRLWATMPPQNPVNSPEVVETYLHAGAQQALELAHFYFFPSLGPGMCPNDPTLGTSPPYADADLRFGLTAEPDGTTYGLMSDDLFWLWGELTDLDRTPDLSQGFTFMDVDHDPVGQGDTISYTISYANHGTYTATNVTVQAAALFALTFQGASTTTITATIGDIAPGETGSITIYSEVDSDGRYDDCMVQTGVAELCEPFRDWAILNAQVFAGAQGVGGGEPLDWLWADHEVDSEAPEFLGIHTPEYLIGAGDNPFRGYAYDPSGVTALTLEVDPPDSSAVPIACPDDTPHDGNWACTWDATTVNSGASPDDGDEFLVRVQATDRYGHTSEWTPWRTFVADTTAPTITFSAETTEAYSGTIITDAVPDFDGSAGDNRGLASAEMCFDGDECQIANLQMNGVPPTTVDDIPGAALSIGACGGGELVQTFTVPDTFDLGEISLGFNITHTKRDELMATLQSPLGTLVEIVGLPEGSPSEYQHYDVLLNDAFPAVLRAAKGDDDRGLAYFDRQARPDDPMQIFLGEPVNGDWTLTLCDANPTENEGEYNRGQLTLQPQNTAVTQGTWFFSEGGFDNQDYVAHTLEAYARDLAGNRSGAETLNFWVDNVAPVLTVSDVLSLAATGATPEPIRVMNGGASDGGEIQQFYALVLTPGGDRQSLQVGRDGDSWWLDLTPQETGDYTIWINAQDAAGNTTTAGPITVTIIRVLVENDGPTALGAATVLTATVLGDSGGYTFDWDFGDGMILTDQAATINHTYVTGVFTSTVTAVKGADTFTSTTRVTVEEAITGLLADNDSPVVNGDVTNLTATLSTGSNVSYQWDFGDGEPLAIDDQAETYHYYNPGTYTATVTAMNAVSTMTTTTRVNVAGLEVENDSPTYLGTATTFTATATAADPVTYTWDFGDSSGVESGPEEVVSHTYAAFGVYTATVEAETAGGTLTETNRVQVVGMDVANNSPTVLGSATTFTATIEMDGPIMYTWDYGDESGLSVGLAAVVSHTYSAAGEYAAVVTATNGTLTVTQESAATVDAEISGLIAINDSPTLLGSETTLTATLSAGSNVRYAWDYGDSSPVESDVGQVRGHTYPAAGTYTAVVTATNGVSVLTATTTITVEEMLSGLALHNDSPTILDSQTNLTATLSAGSHASYAWDFGDGSPVVSGSAAVVGHIYPDAGVYTAVVTATNSFGTLSASSRITITNGPLTGLTATNDSPTALGEVTTLTAMPAGGGGATYDWDFGDGSPVVNGAAAVVGHVYLAAGSYTAVVTATNQYNALTTTTTVNVIEPVSGLQLENDSPTALGASTHFTAAITGGEVVSYAWAFGDGSPMISEQPPTVNYSYPAPGIYMAVVTATNSASVLTATTTVTVEEITTGLHVVNDSPTVLGGETTLTATLSAGSNVRYAWKFGDASGVETEGGSVTSHTYPADGVYTAVVTATNNVSHMSATTTVTVDGTAPQSEITDPVDSQVISGTTSTVRGTAADNIEVALVEVSTDGGANWYPATGTTAWSYQWQLPAGEASFNLRSRAVDAVGNTEAPGPGITVTVDTQPPRKILILTLTDGSIISGTQVVIAGTAEDAPANTPTVVTRIEVSTDRGASWNLAEGTEKWQYTWVLPMENGVEHTVLVRAVDFAGHTSQSDPVRVTVDTVAPQIVSVIPLNGAVDVAADADLVIAFSEAMAAGSLGWEVTPDPGGWVFTWSGDQLTVGAAHAEFQGGTTYSVRLTARDLAGNPLAGSYDWQFSTEKGIWVLYFPYCPIRYK